MAKRPKKNKETGEAFKKLLKEKEFSQYKLEQVTGLDKSVISKIATGQTANPTPTTLEKIAVALGMELGELTKLFAQSTVQSQHSVKKPQVEEPFYQVPISNNSDFVGREEAIAQLDKLVNEGAKVILIHAEGGIGKTTLATKWFELQGLEYLELRVGSAPQNLNSVEDWLRHKLRYYFKENPEQDFMSMLEQFKSKLQEQNIGVLIDNLEPALINGEFIEPHHSYYVELLTVLAHQSVQSVTLITSRELLHEPDVMKLKTFQHYQLQELKHEAWRDYFVSRNIIIDTDALHEMNRAYGGNALAMSLLSSEILRESQGNLKVYWQDNRDNLLRHSTLEKLVQHQFNKLQQDNPQAYKLICRFGFYPNQDINVPKIWLFCLLWDVPKNRRQRVIDDLCGRSLIKVINEGYYIDLVVREVAIENLHSIHEFNNEQLPLIKQEIDLIVASEDKLNLFFKWLYNKYCLVEERYKPSTIRAFYFDLAIKAIDDLTIFELASILERDFAHAINHYFNDPDVNFALANSWVIVIDFPFNLALDMELINGISISLDLGNYYHYNFGTVVALTHFCELNPKFKQELQQLQNQKPDINNNLEIFEQWWLDKSLFWTEQLRTLTIKYRNIGHDWRFTENQQYLLQQYYNANELLVYCLNKASGKVRSHIEDTLLLPIAEIEKRPFKN